MINLMFCGNEKAIDGMIISLLSITKHTKKPLNVFVLTMDLREIDEKYKAITKEQAQILDKIVKIKNINSKVNLVDITKYFKEEMLESKNIKTHYTPYILVRLFSDKVENLPDKILYLDCDLVIYKNIEKLYNMDITNYDYAAVIDAIGRRFIDKNYINSGVLLMNVKKMKKENAFKKCRDMVVTKKMLLPDQTALNKICKDKLYLPNIYNEQKKRQKATVIRHFSMTIKVTFFASKRKRELMKKYNTLIKFLPNIKFLNVKPWNVDGIHDLYEIHDFDDILEKYYEYKKLM